MTEHIESAERLESPLKRISIHYYPLLAYFRRIRSSDPENDALNLIKTTAAEVVKEPLNHHFGLEDCDQSLDDEGLPHDRRYFLMMEIKLATFISQHKDTLTSYPLKAVVCDDYSAVERTAAANFRIDQVLDPQDPIIGENVRSLQAAADNSGLAYSQLTAYASSEDSVSGAKRDFLVVCFTVARDMALRIDQEKYDAVRKKRNLEFFQEISYAELTSQEPDSLVTVYLQACNGRNTVNLNPYVWAEEIMLLVANPQLADDIIAAESNTPKPLRTWCEDFCSIQSQLPGKLGISDYVRPNISQKEYDENVGPILIQLARLQESYAQYAKISFSNRATHSGKSNMAMLCAMFYRGADECLMNSKLLYLTSVFSKYDQAYRTGISQAIYKDKVCSKEGLTATNISLMRYLFVKAYPAKNINIEIAGEKLICRLTAPSLDDLHAMERAQKDPGPVVKIMTDNPPGILKYTDFSGTERSCEGLTQDDITSVFQSLTASGARHDAADFSSAEEAIKGVFDESIVAAKHLLQSEKSLTLNTDNIEELYCVYSFIKYLYNAIQAIYPAEWTEALTLVESAKVRSAVKGRVG